MKIALLTDWFFPHRGGVEWHVHDLACQLQQRGHEIDIITSTPGPPTVSGLPVHRLPAKTLPKWITHWEVPYNLRMFFALAKLLDREGYDLVHSHLSASLLTYLGPAVCDYKQVPTLFTLHTKLWQYNRYITPLNRLIRFGHWRVTLSAVSETIKQDLTPYAQGRPIEIVENGIDIDFWKQLPPISERQRAVQLITVTRFTFTKCNIPLLKITAELRQKLGHGRFHLTLIGEGRQQEAIEQIITHLGLQETVTLLGYQSRAVIREKFAQSDIFVSPSDSESFGIAALEARCAGLPVVGRAESGLVTFIENGREGFLAHSHQELGELLQMLIEDPTLRSTISTHNWHTSPPYDWDTQINKHLALYRRTIAERFPI